MPGTTDNQAVGNTELIKKEIDGMTLRKQTLLASLGNDVTVLEKQKDSVSVKIGNAAYDAYREERAANNNDMAPLFIEMDNIENEIAEKKAKMVEITSRYDEEIEILTKSLNQPLQSPAPEPEPKAEIITTTAVVLTFCEECGTKYTPGVNVFCEECGTRF